MFVVFVCGVFVGMTIGWSIGMVMGVHLFSPRKFLPRKDD